MEELRALPAADCSLSSGGGLNPQALPGPVTCRRDPSAPALAYYDYIAIEDDGVRAQVSGPAVAAYLRMWQVDGTDLKRVTVIVFAPPGRLARDPVELIRATARIPESS